MSSLKGKSFLKLLDFTPEEIFGLVDLAADLKAKKKQGISHRYCEGKNIALRALIGVGTALFGYILGILSFADYNGAGVLMVLVFYFFRGRKWWCFLAQLFCLWYINTEILSGFFYMWEIFGTRIEILRQSFALFALIPIWLYRGEQGYYSKGIKNLYYWFYPVHMLLLCAAREIIT